METKTGAAKQARTLAVSGPFDATPRLVMVVLLELVKSSWGQLGDTHAQGLGRRLPLALHWPVAVVEAEEAAPMFNLVLKRCSQV